ncbi:MAG: maleylpyruvate isomerase family mycothiol-dependent enzyme [Actinobacteria bacterium]|nr:maleylpyruvate isomerase family mycothiol-dependent enzyme [Actinomycetota bacterium]
MSQWHRDLDEVAIETEKLLATVAAMNEMSVQEPAVLPGWTRGHVLAHIEGNADGLARLARYLIDGVERPMYSSREARNADVTLHASWSAFAHLDAIAESAAQLDRDMRGVKESAMDHTVILGAVLQVTASRLAPQRLLEVSVHHSDLGIPSYTWSDWPSRLAEYFIPIVVADFREGGAFPVNWIETDGIRLEILKGDGSGVRGNSLEMLAWLLGRAEGDGLEPVGIASVPTAPPWR